MAEPKDTFLQARRRSRIAIEIWPWLVGFVAVAILPEIALRRLGPSLWGWLTMVGRGFRKRPDEITDAKREA